MTEASRTDTLILTNATDRKYVAAVIPALNEAHNIESLVRQVRRRVDAIVVDDGSTDETAKLAKNAGAYVVSHPTNKGYDAATETGIRTAVKLGYKYAITIDADGQHNPELLDCFNKEFDNGADLIVGVRDRTQRWSEALFCIVGRRIWGLHDPLCGMKGYRLSKLTDNNTLNTYPSVGTELAIRLIKKGIVPHQIPVMTRERLDKSRFGGGVLANMKIVRSLFVGLFVYKFQSHENKLVDERS